MLKRFCGFIQVHTSCILNRGTSETIKLIVWFLCITFNCKSVFASLSKHFQCFKINSGVICQKIDANVSFMITHFPISTDIHLSKYKCEC